MSLYVDVTDIILKAHEDLITRLDHIPSAEDGTRALTAKYKETLTSTHASFINNLETFSTINHKIFIPNPGFGSRNLFKEQTFATSFLDALTFFKLAGSEVDIEDQHPNCKIDSTDGYGIYYIKGPQRSLKINFINLLHTLKFLSEEMVLPSKVLILILNASGEYVLQPTDSSKVITDIFSTEAILKPLQSVTIQCLNPTCAIVENETSLEAAVEIIQGYLCKR